MTERERERTLIWTWVKNHKSISLQILYLSLNSSENSVSIHDCRCEDSKLKIKNPPWTQTILGQACVCHPWFKYFSLQLWLDHSVCHVRSMDCHDSSSRHQDGSHLWDRDHKEDPPAWHAALYDPSNKEVTLWSGHMTRCMKTLSAHSLCLSSSGTKGKSLAFPRGCLCFVTDQNNRTCSFGR